MTLREGHPEQAARSLPVRISCRSFGRRHDFHQLVERLVMHVAEGRIEQRQDRRWPGDRADTTGRGSRGFGRPAAASSPFAIGRHLCRARRLQLQLLVALAYRRQLRPIRQLLITHRSARPMPGIDETKNSNSLSTPNILSLLLMPSRVPGWMMKVAPASRERATQQHQMDAKRRRVGRAPSLQRDGRAVHSLLPGPRAVPCARSNCTGEGVERRSGGPSRPMPVGQIRRDRKGACQLKDGRRPSSATLAGAPAACCWQEIVRRSTRRRMLFSTARSIVSMLIVMSCVWIRVRRFRHR